MCSVLCQFFLRERTHDKNMFSTPVLFIFQIWHNSNSCMPLLSLT